MISMNQNVNWIIVRNNPQIAFNYKYLSLNSMRPAYVEYLKDISFWERLIRFFKGIYLWFVLLFVCWIELLNGLLNWFVVFNQSLVNILCGLDKLKLD